MQVLSANVHRQSRPKEIEMLENCRNLRFIERHKESFQQLIKRRVIIAEQFVRALGFYG